MYSKIFLILLLLPPTIKCQNQQEVLNDIDKLLVENEVYQYPKDHSEFRKSPLLYAGEYGTYDFIIVGAGTAGTIIANRLSAVPNWKILLLEAGENENFVTDIPGMSGLLQYSHFNWGYQTIPQKHGCLGMIDKKCNVPQGKVLGGSSTINFVIYNRGNKPDYDEWGKDNPGWSYDELLPYFIKMENSSLTENVDESYHGHNGSLSVEHVRNFGDLAQAFLDGQQELGKKILDYNGKSEIGFSRIQSNTMNGRRCSGNKAFLEPVSRRENLKIITNAFVVKLLFHNKEVKGVKFLVGDKIYFAKSTKEVILSAGAIGSPQILLHSGIGPKEELQDLGIIPKVNLPVGKNLHDHPFLLYPFASNFTDPSFKSIPEMVPDYLKGFGHLTNAGNLESIGFLSLSSESPNIEQLLSGYFDLTNRSLTKQANWNDETHKAFVEPFGNDTSLYGQVLLHGKSRGSIKLKSSNIFDLPLIDLNYFDNPEDVEEMVQGIREFLLLLDTKPMRKWNSTNIYNPIPQCPQQFMSYEYLRCLVRHVTSSIYHLGGTCKMGPVEDPQSVVNHELKVKEVKNLRVMDASVIPFPVGTHPNALVYVIGDKGSYMILKEYKEHKTYMQYNHHIRYYHTY